MASETHAATEDHSHSILHHHFDDMNQQRECTSLAMWSFLATEVMMFGGLFFTYTLYRWMYPHAYREGSGHLNIVLGTLNTFVLLFSSWTMAMAVHSAQEGQKKKIITWLAITWVLGFSFIFIKGIEWVADYHEGLVPALNWTFYTEHPADLAKLHSLGIGPQNVMMYFVVYFCMAGLHAIHMIIGLILVGYFIFLTSRNQFANGNDQPVEIMGLYWHLIDIIWIFLFPLLYLIPGFHPFGVH